MASLASELRDSCESCSVKELCLPIGLNQAELKQLDSVVKKGKQVEKEEFLYRAGDPLKSIFAVRSGMLKTYVLSDDGAQQITGFHFPGELVGLDGISTDAYQCYAVATENTSVCELPYFELDTYLAQLSAFRSKLLKLLSRELVSEHSHVLLVGQRNSEQKLAAFFIDVGKRLADRGGSESQIKLGMPKSDIANYLSIANETMSRTLKKFKAEGLIKVDRQNIEILDHNGLCNLTKNA